MRRENTWEVPGPTTGMAEHLKQRLPLLFICKGPHVYCKHESHTYSCRLLMDIKLEKWTGRGIRESGRQLGEG